MILMTMTWHTYIQQTRKKNPEEKTKKNIGVFIADGVIQIDSLFL